jgi:hypothetical protein
MRERWWSGARVREAAERWLHGEHCNGVHEGCERGDATLARLVRLLGAPSAFGAGNEMPPRRVLEARALSSSD